MTLVKGSATGIPIDHASTFLGPVLRVAASAQSGRHALLRRGGCDRRQRDYKPDGDENRRAKAGRQTSRGEIAKSA